MFRQIAAAGALAGILAANASAQVVAGPADSLSATAILDTIARQFANGNSTLGNATAASISRSRISSWRADSLLAGMRDIATTGATPDVRAMAVATIAASGTHLGQAAILLEVFDSVQDARTRATILRVANTLPDPKLRRELVVRSLRLNGDRSAEFLIGMAVLTAMTMGEDGVALLRSALADGTVTNERVRALIEAAIAKSMTSRGR